MSKPEKDKLQNNLTKDGLDRRRNKKTTQKMLIHAGKNYLKIALIQKILKENNMKRRTETSFFWAGCLKDKWHQTELIEEF